MTAIRGNRTKMGVVGFFCIRVAFRVSSVQEKFEYIRCICYFQQPCTYKTAGRRVKLVKSYVSGFCSVCCVRPKFNLQLRNRCSVKTGEISGFARTCIFTVHLVCVETYTNNEKYKSWNHPRLKARYATLAHTP